MQLKCSSQSTLHKINPLDDSRLGNIQILFRIMKSIGLQHPITDHFATQLELEIQTAGLVLITPTQEAAMRQVLIQLQVSSSEERLTVQITRGRRDIMCRRFPESVRASKIHPVTTSPAPFPRPHLNMAASLTTPPMSHSPYFCHKVSLARLNARLIQHKVAWARTFPDMYQHLFREFWKASCCRILSIKENLSVFHAAVD